MNFVLIGFTAILLIGCGKPIQGIQGNDFKPYIEAFEVFKHTSAMYTSVTFIDSIKDDPNSQYYTIGYCDPNINSVRILKSFWENEATNAEKRTLVFHELGHCVLGLQHDDQLNSRWDDGCPNSFMNSILMSSDCYDLRYGKDQFSD